MQVLNRAYAKHFQTMEFVSLIWLHDTLYVAFLFSKPKIYNTPTEFPAELVRKWKGYTKKVITKNERLYHPKKCTQSVRNKPADYYTRRECRNTRIAQPSSTMARRLCLLTGRFPGRDTINNEHPVSS